MEIDYAVYSLSDRFYEKYPNPPYKELLKKKERGYACLLIQSHYGYFICIPYRTEISHKYAYHFRKSSRSQKHKSGLDYTKIAIIKDISYIDRIAIIDQDEFAETRKHIYYIAEKAEQYIEEYKKHISGENTLDKREFFFTYNAYIYSYMNTYNIKNIIRYIYCVF